MDVMLSHVNTGETQVKHIQHIFTVLIFFGLFMGLNICKTKIWGKNYKYFFFSFMPRKICYFYFSYRKKKKKRCRVVTSRGKKTKHNFQWSFQFWVNYRLSKNEILWENSSFSPVMISAVLKKYVNENIPRNKKTHNIPGSHLLNLYGWFSL